MSFIPQTLVDTRSPPQQWNRLQNPVSQASSSRRSIQADSRSEEMTMSIANEQIFETEHCQSSELDVVGIKQENDENNDQVTECWKPKSWHDKYSTLDAWLKMKKQNFRAFKPISSSKPQRMVKQVQQVCILLDEFSHSFRPRHLKKAELPPDPADAKKLKKIERRWWNLRTKLKKRGKRLGDACLDQLRNALRDVSSKLEKLPSIKEEPGEQLLSELETVAENLRSVRQTLLANGVGWVEKQLCQVLRNSITRTDLRYGLRWCKNLDYQLQMEIDEKRAKIEGSINDEREFDDWYKEILDWLMVKELESVLEKPLVSTDRMILQQQCEQCEVEHQRFMDRETEVMELLERGRNLSRPQSILDSIKSQWDCLIKRSLDVVNKLKTCVENCDKFYQVQDLLLRWLNETERKLESVKLASLDDIGEQLKELYSLRDEVREKSDDFEQYTNLGRTFINECDVDKDDMVKNGLIVATDEWEKLNHDLINRLQPFEDMDKRFADFNKRMLDLQQKIEEYEHESTTHDALEAAAKDSKLLQRLKELEMEITSVQKSFDAVRRQAGDLVLKAREHGVDAIQLLGEVNSATNHIDNLKIKFGETRDEILEQAYARFVKEIQGDDPVEIFDSSKTQLERSLDRYSELDGLKIKSNSLSRKRSRSNESAFELFEIN